MSLHQDNDLPQDNPGGMGSSFGYPPKYDLFMAGGNTDAEKDFYALGYKAGEKAEKDKMYGYVNALKNNIKVFEDKLDMNKSEDVKLMWWWRDKIKEIEDSLNSKEKVDGEMIDDSYRLECPFLNCVSEDCRRDGRCHNVPFEKIN